MRMSLKNRAVLMSSLGFALGMLIGIVVTAVTTTISLQDGTLHLCAPEFNEFVGDELTAFIIQALVSGVYGAIGLGGSTVYQIEDWSVLKATCVHFAFTVTAYFLTGGFLRWFSPLNVQDDLIMLGIFIAAYVAIWLSHYFAYKIQIEEINKELLQLKRDAHQSKPLSLSSP